MFQIPAAPKGIPISWNGHYYGREGESLAPLTLEEIERIRDQATASDWSIEICADATIADLDTKAIQKARQNFTIKNPHLVSDIEDWDDATFLNKSRLTINGKITRTAILLLGKHESEHFLSPSVAKITWLLKDKDNVEKDYVHYHCPFILAVDDVFAKIRNLKYRYMKSGTLFPDEVDQYAPYSIKESLSNCIAHQDYSLGGRITVTEREDGYLIFSNLGSFIPVTIENVIRRDSPPELYRNRFLAQAMVSLNMIDTIGSGIKRIFRLQRERFFPMPDYDLSDNKVTAIITGKVLDITYANTLARNPELTLEEIILLDKVSKRKELAETEIEHLKEKKLIEGRKPNFHISQKVAERIDKKADYIKNRGFKDDHYKKMIIDFIEKYGSCSKKDIDNLIFDILPSVLTEQQKKNKIRNLVYAMSMKDKLILNLSTKRNPKWVVMRK